MLRDRWMMNRRISRGSLMKWEGVQVSNVAIYNLYWSTYGGGEQVSAAIAEVFEIDSSSDIARTRTDRPRSNKDSTWCRSQRMRVRKVVHDVEASEASADFDVFVNGTYLSRARNLARSGLYYVHFPVCRSRLVNGWFEPSLAPVSECCRSPLVCPDLWPG